MAVATANAVALTGNPSVDGLTQGSAWTFGNGPRVITYSFNTNDVVDTSGAPLGGTWTQYPDLADALGNAFAQWSRVANITFQSVGIQGVYSQSSADIALVLTGNELQQEIGAAAVAIFPDPIFANEFREAALAAGESYPNPEGDIAIDNYYSAFGQGLGQDSVAFTILLHEIGHALGLKHTYDDGGNGRATFSELGISHLDAFPYTLMTQGIGLSSERTASSPMLLDVQAIQQIYGPNMQTGIGDDVYEVNSLRNYVIWDAGGNDTLALRPQGPGGRLSLVPGESQGLNVQIAYGVQIENLLGSEQTDALYGDDSPNRLSGLDGNDRLEGNGGGDTIDAGRGDDEVYGGDGNDVLYGRNGLDWLFDGLGDDRAEGGEGNDLLWSSLGNDVLIGGQGDDRYNDVRPEDQVIEADGEGIDTVVTEYSYIAPDHIENVVLLVSNTDATGNGLDNILTGNPGNNRLSGLGGNDTLRPGGGTDQLFGGPGDDVYELNSGSETIFESPNEGLDTIRGGVALPDNVENLYVGGFSYESTGNALGNTIVGKALPDSIRGGGGNDDLHGGVETGPATTDLLYGEDGDDVLRGAYMDVLVGGPGDDVYYSQLARSDSSFNAELNGEPGNPYLNDQTVRYSATPDYLSWELSELFTADGRPNNLKLTVGSIGDIYWEIRFITEPTALALGVGLYPSTTAAWSHPQADPVLRIFASDGRVLAGAGTGSVLIETFQYSSQSPNNWRLDALTMSFEFRSELAPTAPLTGSIAFSSEPVVSLASRIVEQVGEGDDTLVIDAPMDSSEPIILEGTEVEHVDLRGSGRVDVVGTSAANRLVGNSTENSLDGQDGNDDIAGGDGDDRLFGGAGDDTLDGGSGTNLLSGGPGNDTYIVRSSSDVLTDEDGTEEVISYVSALDLPASIENLRLAEDAQVRNAAGNASANTMIGNSRANLLHGRAGNDLIDGNGGADVLDGGSGNDIYILRSRDITLVDESGFDEIVTYFESYTLPSGFEILRIGSGFDIVLGYGNSVDNYLYANGLGQELHGFAGNDRLYGNLAEDRLEGGSGIDTLYGGDAADILLGQDDDDRLEGEAGDDLMFAGAGNDVVLGGTGADRAWGENGDDLIFGGTDNDSLLGEFGNDRLWGEDGDDDLFGGWDNDQLIGEAGNDRLFGDVGADDLFGGDGLDLLLGENDDDRLFGGNDADDLFGQAGADLLLGEDGNDRLWGGTDADLLFGQAGDDLLQGEEDNDRLFGGDGADLLFGQAGDDELQGEANDDRLFGGAGSDHLFAQAGADELQGEDDADFLYGGDGADVLWGQGGNDTLYGEAGADRFVFIQGGGADIVADFEDGTDLLDLRFYAGATFGNTTIAAQGADTLVTFTGGETALLVGIDSASITEADLLFG